MVHLPLDSHVHLDFAAYDIGAQSPLQTCRSDVFLINSGNWLVFLRSFTLLLLACRELAHYLKCNRCVILKWVFRFTSSYLEMEDVVEYLEL